MKRIHHTVFWPILTLTILVAVYSVLNTHSFIFTTKKISDWILSSFSELISVSVLVFLALSVFAYFSPLGKMKIGGADAVPLLSKWRWFSVTLCTTIATGILFWGTAEPLFHLHEPVPGLGISPNTNEAIRFSIATMFLHWTFIPYGIYTLAGLSFAWSYYNLKQPFSLGAMIYPCFGKATKGFLSKSVDMISLFSLIAGMAASLGAGLIILAGGLESLAGIPYSYISLGFIATLVVGTFILSSISGLQKGIKFLSDINIKIFIGLAIFIFVFGPTLFILKWGFLGFWEFISTFFARSLISFTEEGRPWSQSWTVFYWNNWLAWTPITALFLGKIAKGYTVKEFIRINLLYPSLFSSAWMIIFSTTSLYYDTIDMVSTPLYSILNTEGGVSKIVFSILDKLPIAKITSITFLIATFLSYVTAADSNTSAMSGISSVTLDKKSDEPYIWMKISWGMLIGILAWVMISFSGKEGASGLDGIKMLSNLGGFPALFLMIAVAFGIMKVIFKSYNLKK